VRKHLRISHQATNLEVFLLRGIALYLRHTPRIWQLKYPRPWELAIFKKEKKGVSLGGWGQLELTTAETVSYTLK